MKSIAITLLLWINANSVYEYRGEPPEIVQTEVENLVYMILGEVWIVSEAAKQGIRGLYDVESQTIWLRDDFDPNDKRQLGYLVHELVHFLQSQNTSQSGFGCGRELEIQAYAMQNKFLLEYGLPALAIPTDKLGNAAVKCAGHQ